MQKGPHGIVEVDRGHGAGTVRLSRDRAAAVLNNQVELGPGVLTRGAEARIATDAAQRLVDEVLGLIVRG